MTFCIMYYLQFLKSFCITYKRKTKLRYDILHLLKVILLLFRSDARILGAVQIPLGSLDTHPDRDKNILPPNPRSWPGPWT